MDHYIDLVAQVISLATYIRKNMSNYDQGRGQVIGDIDRIIQLLKDVCQKYGTEEKNLPGHLRRIIQDIRTELNGLKKELDQGRISQVMTIMYGGDLMNRVTDCKNKLSEILQRGQFALTLDGRIAQDVEHRRAHQDGPVPLMDKSSYSYVNEAASPIQQQSYPRATGRSQTQQQSQPTPPRGDPSYPDYTKSDSMYGTGPSQQSQPHPPSHDGNRYGPTGMNQFQQQRQLGHRNGHPSYSTINVPGTSLVGQQSPPAQPWVHARQQHRHYGNLPDPAMAVGGGTASHRAFPTAGSAGPFTIVNVNMVAVPDPARAAAAPANSSPHRKKA